MSGPRVLMPDRTDPRDWCGGMFVGVPPTPACFDWFGRGTGQAESQIKVTHSFNVHTRSWLHNVAVHSYRVVLITCEVKNNAPALK